MPDQVAENGEIALDAAAQGKVIEHGDHDVADQRPDRRADDVDLGNADENVYIVPLPETEYNPNSQIK